MLWAQVAEGRVGATHLPGAPVMLQFSNLVPSGLKPGEGAWA